MNNNFNKDEIVIMRRKNKRTGKTEERQYPIVGGRLRLFHEDLENRESDKEHWGVKTEIQKYENDVAVVTAVVTIEGNQFTGIGMASKQRDSMIFPAILEMAETRAIARALRFAGYGVEYTGAEEMGGMKDDDGPEPAKYQEGPVKNRQPARQEPRQEPQAQESPSLKRQVWDVVVNSFGDMYSTKQLGDAMKDFIESIMDKYDKGTSTDKAYDVVLAHRDHFHKSFGKKLIEMYPKRTELPPDEELVTPEQAAQVRKSIDELAESKAIEPEPPRIDPVKKLKAEILMGLPDGINVIALNKTLAYMIEVNPDREPAEVLEIIAGDLGSFEPMIRKFCKTEGIKSGLPGDEEDEPVAQTDNTEKPDNGTTDKPEYSEFRQKWINLKWDDFNSFLIRNADEFKANREEYDAAVKKYDRLKKNNGAENMCFPYLFGPHPDQSELPELSTENSVIEKNPVQSRFSRTEEASLMKQFQASMPKMMKKTSDACGISPHSTDPDEISTFLDELQHQVHTWETKNFGKTYTEET